MNHRAPSRQELLDLTTLRVVIAVAEAGSISAGSERSGLALGAVSARITALEHALGMALFERGPRGVRLTAAGQRLVQQGQELIARSDRLVRELQDEGQGRRGHVRVLANASSLIEFLPARLTRFQQQHPQVQVDIEERSSPEIPLSLLEERADMGIVDLPHPVQGLRSFELFHDQLVLLTRADDPIARQRLLRLEDVIDHPFVCLPDGNAISGRLVATAAMQGHALAVRMRMRSFDAVCRMVAAGLGLSVLPLQAIAPQLAALPLAAVPLANDWARRTHRLMMRADLPPTSVIVTLASELRQA